MKKNLTTGLVTVITLAIIMGFLLFISGGDITKIPAAITAEDEKAEENSKITEIEQKEKNVAKVSNILRFGGEYTPIKVWPEEDAEGSANTIYAYIYHNNTKAVYFAAKQLGNNHVFGAYENLILTPIFNEDGSPQTYEQYLKDIENTSP